MKIISTQHESLGRQFAKLAARVGLLMLAAAAALNVAENAQAQRRQRVHNQYDGNWPPGTIGQRQLLRNREMQGYYQPIELRGPDGSKVSLVVGGAFTTPQPTPVKAGMLIGQVYRFRVTGIPVNEGLEVFPTVEVIDRLHPPEHLRWKFPIPIELTREDMELAIAGKYVTRVIYVENPTTALAIREDPKLQRYYEARPDADPVEVADNLGRPVAILRIGSRFPSPEGPDAVFTFGSPPLELFNDAVAAQVERNEAVGQTEIEAAPPRIQLPRRP